MKNTSEHSQLFGELRECIHAQNCTLPEIANLVKKLDSFENDNIGKHYASHVMGSSHKVWELLENKTIDSIQLLSSKISSNDAALLLKHWNELSFNHDVMFYDHARGLEDLFPLSFLYDLTWDLIKTFLEPYQVEVFKIYLAIQLPTRYEDYINKETERKHYIISVIADVMREIEYRVPDYCSYFNAENTFPDDMTVYMYPLSEQEDVNNIERWICVLHSIINSTLEMYIYSRDLISPSALVGSLTFAQEHLNLIVADISKEQAFSNAKTRVCNEITKHALIKIAQTAIT